jgi:4-amino-4-deoxy-L-arabinose transferase-like glycosyltransferase
MSSCWESLKTKEYGVILFLSIVLFAQMSWVPGFFHDGYLYAALGKNAAELGSWLVPFQSNTQYPEFNQHPPFIFMIEGLFFKLFGSGYTQARVFSALWGVGVVSLVFCYLRKWGKAQWGFGAAIALTVMPYILKKIRFPNLDFPLMFFTCACLFSYFDWFAHKKSGKSWLLIGAFWGGALLTKGIIAFIIPFVIVVHLIVEKKLLSTLKDFWAYGGVLVGLILFSLWPLGLMMSGNFEIFTSYLDVQLFGTVVKARGGQESGIFAYVVHLFTYEALFTLCAIVGLWVKRKSFDSLHRFGLIWFLAMIIPLSFIKFKYSHYILPLYPALAILTAWFFDGLEMKSFNRTLGFTRFLAMSAAVVLLVFPITSEGRRDRILVKTSELLKGNGEMPSTWVSVGESYPYWSLSGYASFNHSADPQKLSVKEFLKDVKMSRQKKVYFVTNKFYLENEQYLKTHTKALLRFHHPSITVLINYNQGPSSIPTFAK